LLPLRSVGRTAPADPAADDPDTELPSSAPRRALPALPGWPAPLSATPSRRPSRGVLDFGVRRDSSMRGESAAPGAALVAEEDPRRFAADCGSAPPGERPPIFSAGAWPAPRASAFARSHLSRSYVHRAIVSLSRQHIRLACSLERIATVAGGGGTRTERSCSAAETSDGARECNAWTEDHVARGESGKTSARRAAGQARWWVG
jgi:hypothetical protein